MKLMNEVAYCKNWLSVNKIDEISCLLQELIKYE